MSAQTRERWEQIEALLDVLETLPENERAAYLSGSGLDPDVRHAVEEMLAVESEASAYLDRFSEELTPSYVQDLRGKQVGAYQLIRPIGRGGMGVVYEAKRADGEFEQRVALKLLSLALAGTEAHQRFLEERRILAALEHASIARIVDGGVTEDGTPWFAMEYVEGEPIDAWCRSRRLSIRHRLELFLEVCHAVEHAHRRLVVHRDIKPANVLVTSEGKIKLLDFGIAKLLNGAGEAHSTTRLMTPAYASPEQLRGDPVTTAADVYQLAVLLHELLTGQRPGTSPRALRGDLGTIVAKASSQEPERRYGSVEGLAQDVRRHLQGRPVLARPDSWPYRGRKFAERHALGVLATISALLVAAAMIGYHVVRVGHERDAAQAQRDRARAEAAKADEISRFLVGLFRGTDPRESRGAALTARELLDRGVVKVNRDLATQPDLQEQMLRVLGRTYLELGVHDSAEAVLTRAVEIARRRVGAGHADYAAAIGNLAELRLRQGEYARALSLLHESLRTVETAEVLETLGQTYRRLGEHEKSLDAINRAMALKGRTGDLLNLAGAVLTEQGQYARAEEMYARAIGIHEHDLGGGHPLVGAALQNLAFVRRRQGKVEGVETMYRRGLSIQEKAYGPLHRKVAASISNVGHFLAESGRHDEAIVEYKKALQVYTAVLRPDHPEIGYVLVSLGDAQRAVGRFDEARRHYRRAVAVRVKSGQRFDPLLFHSFVYLGRLEPDPAAAERAMNEALILWALAPKMVDPQLDPALRELGSWLVERGRCAEAAPLCSR